MESDEGSISPPPPSEPAPKLPPPLPAVSLYPCYTQDLDCRVRGPKGASQLPTQSDGPYDPEAELDDDEISQQMTQSYSEISRSGLSPDNETPRFIDGFSTAHRSNQAATHDASVRKKSAKASYMHSEPTLQATASATGGPDRIQP
ncbi:hypothetical protein NQ317_016349 [Molorchus minor]|uniref:Uncharacterized protein n=1 Tax=Molorchus minor TaxID=1323400 RepID=A0ABQ9ISL1_9CUCU|nr:hypothetical protein NQ317_016349 [Molorchus minor]